MISQSPGQPLRRSACTLLSISLLLGGCVHGARSVVFRHYDLGTTVAATADDGHAASRTDKVLQIAALATPPWLAGTAMHYRLDYRNDQRLAAYAQSDWIAPPATLLESILRGAIAAGGDWRAVIGPRDPAQADSSLHIRLDDFSQVFSQPDDSVGVIDITATLIDNHDDHVIAQRHFHVEVAAPTPDASGGVKALGEAGRELAAQLQHWLH